MLIIGAKGHAVEVLQCLSTLDCEELVFFDNVTANQPNQVLGLYPLLQTAAAAQHYLANVDPRFVLGLGGPALRQQLAAMFRAWGGQLTTVTAATAIVETRSADQLGAGLNLMHYTLVSPTARLGEGVLLNAGAAVHHDAEVGPYCEISPGARLLGRCILGSKCQVGALAAILPGVKLGDGAIIGAGSVVTRDVPAGTIVAGVPARQLPDNY